MPSLADLSAQWDRWLSGVAEAGGVVSPEAEAEFQEMMGFEPEKIEAYGCVVDDLKERRLAVARQIDRYKAKDASLERQLDWLKAKMGEYLNVRGARKIKGTSWTAGWHGNGGPMPIVVDLPVDQISVRYHKQLPLELDMSLVRKALEAGVEIEGVRFTERGQHVAFW